jgi:internalin A
MSFSPILESAIRNKHLTLKRSAQGEILAAHFEGGCDEFLAVCQLGSLVQLNCDSSHITDNCFGRIVTLRGLEELSIQFTQISGRSLKALIELPKLRTLVCNPVSFVSDGCKAIASCDALIELDLSCMTLCDQDLSHVLSIRSLRELSLTQTTGLTDNCLHMAIPPCVSLTELGVGDTKMGDSFCHSLIHVKSLRSLRIGSTRVTNAGLSSVSLLPELETLRMDNTVVDDIGIRCLRDLTTLRVLSASGCPITDGCIEDLARMERLTDIDVSGTRLSRDGVSQLRAMRKWERFYCD